MAMWNPWRGCKKCSDGCLHCYIHKGDFKGNVNTNEIVKTKDFEKPIEKLKNGNYKMKSGLVYTCFSTDFLIDMYPHFIGYLYRNEENPLEYIATNMRKNRKFSAIRDENGSDKQLYSPIAIANYFRDKKNMSPYDFAKLDFSKAIDDFGLERNKVAAHSKNQVKTNQEH